MPFLTPGLAFLGRGLTYFTVYMGSAYYAITTIASGHGVEVPAWVVIAGAIVAAPVFGRLYVFIRYQRQKRRAAALGARVFPKAVGAWPGNLDILKDSLKNLEIGYPGDGLEKTTDIVGYAFNLDIMYSDLIFTACPEHLKTMLATDFQNYVKGERFQEGMGSVLGTGVFNSDGDMWKFHRSITRPVFTRDRIADFDLFDRHSDQVLVKLKERLREGHAIDFQDLMLRFTIDTATEFLFGNCVHALSAGLPYPPKAAYVPPQQQDPAGRIANEFSAAFLRSQEIISVRERSGWLWPLSEIWEDKTIEPMKVVNAYLEPIIHEAVERRKNTLPNEDKQAEKESEDNQTLLDSLMDATMDPRVLRDEILNIMIAGRDTTAATLTFAVYLLSQHPIVFQRLRSEILEKIGPNRRPSFEDLKELKYLRAVLNETLRLFPVVPFNVRESINEAVWPSPDPSKKPLYVPPGTKTAYSVFVMHRRTDLWGPDAEEYDPDRFLDDRLQKYLVKNSFIFLPFNAGPRICLGQQFAYNEMSFMMIRLLQTFSEFTLDLASGPDEATPPAAWGAAPGRKATEKVWPKMHLTMYANGGLWIKMKESDSV
ncbi:hypothetical protein D9611_000513 [Ephemerocybe angulata]|uniref:Cytochrome P450 n=1 Tax=Ephemerocybe angulata TaxID=980116 RepID=A0A8H5F7L0_9AGAR|nr:hypothetical protein D9611_000513 [Tulosesus angulatus]